jgi:hypothetical protein
MHIKIPAALSEEKMVHVNDGTVLCGVKNNANRVQYTIFTPNNGACKNLSGTVLSHNGGSNDAYGNSPAEQ